MSLIRMTERTAPSTPAANTAYLYLDSVTGKFRVMPDTGSDYSLGTMDHTELSNIGTNTHAQIDTHIASTSNPHSVTKSQVGLGSVTNALQLVAANNLSDLADAPTARTNIGLGNVANSLQLVAANNLSDLTNAATARTNIGLGNVANSLQLVAANNLSDLVNATTARTNIGLGSVTNDAQLKIASNLSDVASASTSRTNLGLGTSSTVQFGLFSVGTTASTGSITTVSMAGAGTSTIQNGVFIGGTITGTSTYDSIGRGVQGFYLAPTVNNATNVNGIYSFCQLDNAAVTVTNIAAIQAYTGYGYNSGASVTNARGIWIKSWGNVAPGTFTNQYGLYLESISGATNNWAIYSLGGASYHAGQFRINSTSVSAQLGVVCAASGTIASIIRGASSQSANLTEWQNSSSTVLSCVASDGKIGAGTTSPTAFIDVNSDTIRVRTAKTPASAAASGNQGDIVWDTGFIYVCTATNTWKRVAIATW